MTTAETFALAALIVSILGSLAWLIFNSGKIFNRVERVEKDVTDIKADVNEIKTTIPVLANRVETLWKARIAGSNSPRQLNELGEKIFEQSGIKQIIEENSERIIQKVRVNKPQTTYKAEEYIIEAVQELKNDPSLIVLLEDGAFKVGSDVDTVLLAGAIGMRDSILTQLDLKLSNSNLEG